MIKKFFIYILLFLIVISTANCRKIFVENEITITYNANGGSGTIPNPLTTISENYVTIANSNSISKIGHQFLGWSANISSIKPIYTAGQKVLFAKSTTLYAIWTPDEHTIYYNPNGGNGTIFSQTIYYGVSTKTSDGKSFTKTHYYVSAWDTKADSSGTRYIAGNSAAFTSDDTLYAVWSPKTYKITYNVNGGSGTLTQDFLYGNLVTLSNGSAISKIGHTLNGWCKNSTDTILTYSLNGSASFVSDTILYALWKPNTYHISYNANSGSGTIASQSFVYGNPINLSNGNGFSKTNYTFKGWNTKADGSGFTYSSGASYSSASDITLYAIWETNILISYYPNGGSGTVLLDTTTNLDSLSLKTGSEFIKKGYKVSVWNTKADSSGITYLVNQKVKFSSNTNLYAFWSLATYIVTYNANEGSGTIANQSFLYGDSVTLSNGKGFSKTDHDLIGWGKKSTDTNITYSLSSSAFFDSDTTLYAIWINNKYTITYDANQGSGNIPIQNFTYGVPLTLNNGASFSRTYYTLSSWNTKTDGTGKSYNLGSSATINTYNNITLYAIWTANKYKITYNANSGSETSHQTQEFAYEVPLTLNNGSAFSKTHYTLSSWNTKADGTGIKYGLTSLTKFNIPNDFTLYAIWEAKEYKITYNANEGINTGVSVQPFTYGNPITLFSQTGFSKTGCTLKGWGKKSTDTDISYALRGSASFISDTTLYAIWKANIYYVYYKANGGTGYISDQYYVYGNPITFPQTGFSRAGYTLTSWNTIADGTGKSYTLGSSAKITFGYTINLYAIWTANKYIITYANNGGNGSISALEFTYGTSTTLNNGSAFSRTGYTLTSWNTKADGTGTNYTLGSSNIINVPNNFTLYAIWTANKYTITYNANSGSNTGSSTQEFTYGTSINFSNTISKAHYTLTSWNTKADGTGKSYEYGKPAIINVPNDFTLYAIWTINKYAITYNANGGFGTLPNSDTVTVEKTHTIGSGSSLTKIGYGFLGWSTNSSASSAQYSPGANITFYSNTTLYAVWGVVTCTLTFDANGGTCTTPLPNPISFQSNAGTITIPAYYSTYIYKSSGITAGVNDYIFYGWTTKEYKDNFDHLIMPYYKTQYTYTFYSNITLYAAWRLNRAIVVYKSNGGSGSMDNSISAYNNYNVTISNNKFTKEGYTFLTWNMSPDASDASFTPGTTYFLTHPVTTLYAIWRANN